MLDSLCGQELFFLGLLARGFELFRDSSSSVLSSSYRNMQVLKGVSKLNLKKGKVWVRKTPHASRSPVGT